MNKNDLIYGFVMKGVLTDIRLDQTQRVRKRKFTNEEYQHLIDCLGTNELDEEIVRQSQKMAIVYAGITAFENTVRKFIKDVLVEEYNEHWWDKHVSVPVKAKAEKRKNDESIYKWHTPRGEDLMNYIDFTDLFIIIKNNWEVFDPFLSTVEWVEYILKTIALSRNVIMHSGDLANQDIERVGSLIRDWIKQTGN